MTTETSLDDAPPAAPITAADYPLLYLAGPMSRIAEFNYPAFRSTTASLRAAGFEVWSPVEHTRLDTSGMTGHERNDPRLASFDIKAAFAEYASTITLVADAVAVLSGWENSPGARAEVALALAIGKPVVDANTLCLLDPTITAHTARTGPVGAPVRLHSVPEPISNEALPPGACHVLCDWPVGSHSTLCNTEPGTTKADVTSARALARNDVVNAGGLLVPRLIGLSGYAQSGKDTVAAIINRLYGHQQVSPSDILREFLYAQDIVIPHRRFGFFPPRAVSLNALVDKYGWEVARRKHPYIRGLQQRTGTEAGRDVIDPDLWVDAVMRRVEGDGAYTSTSVRFLNEAEAITAQRGVLIRVTRPGVGAVNAHPSDTIMDAWDFEGLVINNDGDLRDLEQEVRRVLAEAAARLLDSAEPLGVQA